MSRWPCRRATSSVCSVPTAPGSRRCSACWRRWWHRRAGRSPTAANASVIWAKAFAAASASSAHELHLYPELTARQNLEFFAQLHGLVRRDGAGRCRARAGRISPTAATTRWRRSRAACGSAWRSSARCCIGRAWCCSTSRSPVSTTGRCGIVADRLQRIAAEGAIIVLATHDLDVADGLITRMAVVRRGACCPTWPPASASGSSIAPSWSAA